MFSIKLEQELIRANTHFWCEGCLSAIPIEKQSVDFGYCEPCRKQLEGFKAEAEYPNDGWEPGQGIYRHYTGRYVLRGRGLTRALPKQADHPSDGGAANAGNEKPVSKLLDKGFATPTANGGIMKQRGRPRKEGDGVSRVTKWRRAKETRGALV